MLKKIHIENFRTFRKFDLAFRDGLNILVGSNDAGKTTLLEAISLALTSRFRGRPLLQELSPHLINQEAQNDFVEALARGEAPTPPAILIELYLEDRDEFADLKGQNNHEKEDAPGLRVEAAFNSSYSAEYERFLASDDVTLVPTEYFDVRWLDFGGKLVSRRSVPVKASFIDASALRLHAGADYYLQKTIDEQLDDAERVELSRVYRSLRERFSEDEGIASINEKLGETQKEVTPNKRLSLSIDLSKGASWESSLVPHLDELPLQFIGGGGQSTLKILLALYRSLDNCHVVLIEEPENHQSPASLNVLVEKIRERCEGRQVFLSTHSSFVLNKLGLENLALLGEGAPLRLGDLDFSTFEYFKKLPGYDTLRVVLAEKMILVEGPSDELVFQRAYKDRHGKLPIEDGIDVISVGLSAPRFVEIAAPLGKSVDVLLDNDGDTVAEVEARFAAFKGNEKVRLHVSDPASGRTLEPQLVNSAGREVLNEIFSKSYGSDDELVAFMSKNKTTCGLRIFETSKQIKMPSYIEAAVG